MKYPKTPFSTHFTGGAKEVEMRLCSIFRWEKRRPPVFILVLTVLLALSCGSLIGCHVQNAGASDNTPKSDVFEETVTADQSDLACFSDGETYFYYPAEWKQVKASPAGAVMPWTAFSTTENESDAFFYYYSNACFAEQEEDFLYWLQPTAADFTIESRQEGTWNGQPAIWWLYHYTNPENQAAMQGVYIAYGDWHTQRASYLLNCPAEQWDDRVELFQSVLETVRFKWHIEAEKDVQTLTYADEAVKVKFAFPKQMVHLYGSMSGDETEYLRFHTQGFMNDATRGVQVQFTEEQRILELWVQNTPLDSVTEQSREVGTCQSLNGGTWHIYQRLPEYRFVAEYDLFSAYLQEADGKYAPVQAEVMWPAEEADTLLPELKQLLETVQYDLSQDFFNNPKGE